MPSETDLLNDALGQIGASRITAIDDGNGGLTYFGVPFAYTWEGEGTLEFAK